MPRTTIVQSARKPQGNCRKCGRVISIGDTYKWAKPRYKSKFVVCSNCQITVTDTSSSKMVPVWAQQEAIGTSDIDDLSADLQSLADTAREVGEEYQESCDNQREHFPDAEVAAENEEKAESLSSWADEIEEAVGTIDEKMEELTVLRESLEAKEAEESEAEESEAEESEDDEEDTADDIRGKIEDLEGEIQELASVADECPA